VELLPVKKMVGAVDSHDTGCPEKLRQRKDLALIGGVFLFHIVFYIGNQNNFLLNVCLE